MWVMQHFLGGNSEGSVIFLCLTRSGPGLPFQLCLSPTFLLALGSISGYAYTPRPVTVLDPAVCSSLRTLFPPVSILAHRGILAFLRFYLREDACSELPSGKQQ